MLYVHRQSKKHAAEPLYVSLPTVDRLSKFFHWHILR